MTANDLTPRGVRNTFPGVRSMRTLVSIARHQFGRSFRIFSRRRTNLGEIQAETCEPVRLSSEVTEEVAKPINNRMDIVENENPLKASINLARPVPYFRRKWNDARRAVMNFYRYLNPELTETEKKVLALKRLMNKEIRKYTRRISNKLANLGYSQPLPQGGERKIRFSAAAYDLDPETGEGGNVLILRVEGDPRYFPKGVSYGSLITPETVNELMPTCEHPTSGDMNEVGIFYTIMRGGELGIPNTVMWSDLMPTIPESAPPLTFMLGRGNYGKNERRTLESMPHMILVGETGGGKSNGMHQILCTFIARNTPADVRMLMVDMKNGGVELPRYAGIPHLIRDVPFVPTGIAKDLEGGIAILEYLYQEMTVRGEMFARDPRKPQNIDEWNKYHKTRRLPRIVLAIDEIALMMDKSDAEDKEEKAQLSRSRQLIKDMLSLSRFSGIHLLSATQTLDKTIMGQRFKTNVPGRLCFHVADAAGSILAIGNGDAVRLNVPGRAYFKKGIDFEMVQTPLITPGDIATVVSNAKAGMLTSSFTGHTLTPEEIIRWSIAQNSLSLAERNTFNQFGSQIELAALRQILREMSGRTYVVDGQNCKVVRGDGRVPRHVEIID